MRKIAVVAIVSAALTVIAACKTKGLATIPSDNQEVKVDVLTRFNGITLYRVQIGERDVYIADRGPAEAGIQRTEWRVGCGKNCTRAESVVAVQR